MSRSTCGSELRSRLELQSGCRRWISACELLRQLADEMQFAFVELIQRFVHVGSLWIGQGVFCNSHIATRRAEQRKLPGSVITHLLRKKWVTQRVQVYEEVGFAKPSPALQNLTEPGSLRCSARHTNPHAISDAFT